MSKKASDKRTYSPSSTLPHLASRDAYSSQGPDWGLEMNDAAHDKRLAKLVERMKTAKPAMHEPLGNEGNQTNHFLNDGGPAKSRNNVWDTVRRCGTAIVAQTVNFDVLTELPFASTMFDTASAVQGLSIRETAFYAWIAVRRTLDSHSLQNLDVNAAAIEAAELYLVELGVELMSTVTGLHFLFLDPHFGSTVEIVSHARRMIDRYETHKIDRKRLVISIPASEEGIAASQLLEKDYGIATNLYLVSGFFHAVVCVEAGASFITFSCAQMDTISKQQQKSNRAKIGKRSPQQAPEWRWLAEIQATAEYLSLNSCKTQSILTDLCGEFTPELLRRVNSICVRDDGDLERLDLLPVQNTACPADSNLSLQARQMHYPTTYLAQGTGFLPTADAQTRSRASIVVRHGVAAMRQARKDLNAGMKAEVLRQLQLLRLDAAGLAAMYEQEVFAEQQSRAPSPTLHSLNKQESTRASNPRANHVGYRIAQIQWDKAF